MPTLIIVQVGLGRAVHDIEANEAIARLESHKNRPITMQVEAGMPTTGAINIHRQYRHTSLVHTSIHSAVMVADGVASNASTDAIIAKRSAHDNTNMLDRTDTRDQRLPNGVPTETMVDGDIPGIALGSLCGPTLHRAVSLRLSWGEEMGMNPNSGSLGILQQMPKTM